MRLGRTLPLLLGLAFVLRLAAYFSHGGIVHADEIFQYAEPAHRLVFGQGIVTWEYRLGVRSWLFPGFLAGVMEVARLAGDGPVVQNAAIAVALSLLSLPAVACGFLWARRCAGEVAAVASGVLLAAWPDAVLLSIHPLIDGAAAALLLPALYALERRPGIAGCLLGLTAMLRIPLAPVVAFAGLRGLWGQTGRAWAKAAAAGAAVVLACGLLDWATLGRPFQSIIKYIWVNQAEGAADYYGVESWAMYLVALVWSWGWLTPVFLLLLAAGARRMRLAAETAGLTVLLLSLIPHKELRFMYPAVPLVLAVAGAGVPGFARWLSARAGQVWNETRAVPAALLSMMALCGAAFAFGNEGKLWVRGTGVVALMHRVAADKAACALAIVPSSDWFLSGGYTHLRPGIRLVRFDPPDRLHAAHFPRTGDPHVVRGFDYALADSTLDLRDYGLRPLLCARNMSDGESVPLVCLWHNQAGCDDVSLPELTAPDPPFLARPPR